jgi:hypothetical protein
MNMRKSIVLLPALFIAGGASSFGAVPVARVISAQQIVIDGIAAPARNYVPVGVGGDVNTLSASALLQFPDGSTIELQPNSELRISGAASKPVVRVIHGSAQYKIAPNSLIRVAGSDTTDRAAKGDGAAKIGTYALAQIGNMGRYDTALIYGTSAGQSAGVITPSGVTSTGIGGGSLNFASIGRAASGSFAGDNTIITPGGLTIYITPILNTSGQPIPNEYSIAGITQTVPLSGGGTTTLTLNPSVSTGSGSSVNLIGSTITLTAITTSAPGTSNQSQVSATFTTTSSGTPVTLPLTSVATSIQTSTTTAVTNFNATATGGSTASAPTSPAVNSNNFSSTAP